MAKKPVGNRETVEKELSELNSKAGDLMLRSYCESAFDLFGELRHRAKSENNLAYYSFATFFQMNLAQRLLRFETVRERAVELIAVFENEEQARKIEPELELETYDGLKYSMCACAYEVLAEATGDLEGYNSEGMQDCLTGGIEVCHRIGKLSCIGCFREYACDIHKAADDYELARYHCDQVLKHGDDFSDRGDRRWLANLKLATIDMLEGQLESARQRLERSWELAQLDSVNDSVNACICIAFEMQTIDLLEGKATDPEYLKIQEKLPPRGECAEYDYELDCLAALRCVKSELWEEGEQILMQWNQDLRHRNAMTKWLETGIRLVASKRLRGDFEAAKRMTRSFEDAATKANDWLSLRRLNQILDPSIAVTPLGTLIRSPKISVPEESPSVVRAEPPLEGQHAKVYHEISTDTPLYAWLQDFSKRLYGARESNPEEFHVEDFRMELLESQNRDWSHPEDAGRAIYFMIYLVTPGCDYRAIWTWANRLVSRFQETGYLVSLLARLGMSLNASERFEQFSKMDFGNFDQEMPTALIESDRLDLLIRKSLQLDSGSVNNNFRAGEVFEYIDKMGEAERCYARAFKLDRKREDAALALARIYTHSDRNSDAHYVLDLCIREGGSSSELFFEAAMRAHSLGMHELQVNYLRTLMERFPPLPWANYYMSIGLLELKKPKEALDAIQQESAAFLASGIHVDSIRAEAFAQLSEFESARDCIVTALGQPISETEDLTYGGIASAMERLWRASKLVPNSDALRKRVELRMLQCGTAPEEYFHDLRSQRKPRDLDLFHVSLLQPLDENWYEFEGCLPDQTEWNSYVAHWGVLAEDSAGAAEFALEFQRLCYPLEPTVLEVHSDDELLHDRPGVAFQGSRTPGDDFEDEDDLNDEEDEEDSPF